MANLTQNLRTNAQNRKLYWLFGQLNIHNADAIKEIVWKHTGYRTFHTSELTFIECMDLIKWLESSLKGARYSKAGRIEQSTDDNAMADLDRKRKGVIRAIFRWGELQGVNYTMDYVKGIACRAAGVDSFNRISPEALSRIYYEFCNKQRVAQTKNEIYNPISNN